MISRPTLFSTEKAERELGWRPEIPVRDGLAEAVRLYREARESAAVAQPA